jgi:hypothetical protein
MCTYRIHTDFHTGQRLGLYAYETTSLIPQLQNTQDDDWIHTCDYYTSKCVHVRQAVHGIMKLQPLNSTIYKDTIFGYVRLTPARNVYVYIRRYHMCIHEPSI